MEQGSACDSSQEGIALVAVRSHYITNFDASYAGQAARVRSPRPSDEAFVLPVAKLGELSVSRSKKATYHGSSFGSGKNCRELHQLSQSQPMILEAQIAAGLHWQASEPWAARSLRFCANAPMADCA